MILYSPGKEIYNAALNFDASDEDWTNFYRYLRVELMVRTGLVNENPGEQVKRRWEALQWPREVRFQEDVDDAVSRFTGLYRDLVRHSVVLPDLPADEKRILTEMNHKVPRGT